MEIVNEQLRRIPLNRPQIGSGNAGTIEITASDLILKDRGGIAALSLSGTGGNINLKVDNLLSLINNTEISATAGLEETLGNGGNITIDSELILAFPSKNNHQITAEAFDGDGGNIRINTNSILGRENITISASSNLGLEGNISINTPDIDPTSGLVKLPDVPIDAETILAQNLCKFEDEKIAKGSSFIITGRGGLTPTSEEPLENLDRVVRWANRDNLKISKNGLVGVRQRSESETLEPSYPVIQQSQGWVTTSDGSVWLIANAPETIPQNSGIVHPDCRTLR